MASIRLSRLVSVGGMLFLAEGVVTHHEKAERRRLPGQKRRKVKNIVNKPSVFIGSSSEGLEFARATRGLLDQDAEITLWNEGFFDLGTTFIEALINNLPRFDFAILVFTGDDLINSRKVEAFGPRDNVIFELGLFMGQLGRTRTFILLQKNANLKIPSDLSGVVTATYEWPRENADETGAVGVACDRIRKVMRDLGLSDTKTGVAIGDIRSRQERQENELSKQQAEIRSLQIALQGVVTRYEFDKLVGLSKEEPFLCQYSNDLENELKRLRALGLVQNHDGVGISAIRRDYNDNNQQFDLRRFFFITEEGREYLKLRSQLTVEGSAS